LWNSSQDNSILLNDDSVYRTSRALSTKLWNLIRYVLTNILTDDYNYNGLDLQSSISDINNNILNDLRTVILEYNNNMDNYEFMSVCKGLHKFIKDTFCNIYLEAMKSDLTNINKNMIMYIVINILQLLHPIMPYVTETCWQLLVSKCDNLPKSILLSQFYQ
jgi:valyl-tRNA synthetase